MDIEKIAMKIAVDYPKSVRDVNRFLWKNGMPKDVQLRKGRGYYYFSGGDTAGWFQSGVYVFRIDDFTYEGWLGKYEQKVEDYEK